MRFFVVFSSPIVAKLCAMKRFFAFLSAALTLFSLRCCLPSELPAALGRQEGTIEIYCRSYDGTCIQNGSGVIVFCGFDGFEETLGRCHGVDGVAVSFSGELSDVVETAQKLSLNVVFEESVANVATIYGYSPLVKGGIFVDGQYINVQIAYSDGIVKVGSPLILGSF